MYVSMGVWMNVCMYVFNYLFINIKKFKLLLYTFMSV